ncbi:MAG: iron-sulfur cluster assembly protein [Bacteroidota bacterium]
MENPIDLNLLKEQVLDTIKTVYDPELPVNIYELGLVYDIQITEAREAVILMTLTAPNCPEAEGLPVEVERKVMEIPEITKCKVIITFDPPWERSYMSEVAQIELGFF